MTIETKQTHLLLKEFVLCAHQCAMTRIRKNDFNRFRLHNGVAFEVTDQLLNKQIELVDILIKKLGPAKGHQRTLSSALWDFVVSVDDISDLESRKFLIDGLQEIERKSAELCDFYRPCPLVRLPDGTDLIKIGPVKVVRSESLLPEFRTLSPHCKFRVGADWSLSALPTDVEGQIVVTVPHTVWSIRLSAAAPNREVEALWLTDVALSILRMSVERARLGSLAPSIGDVEPHPFRPHDLNDHSLALVPGVGANMGGMTAARNYWLAPEVVQSLVEPQTVAKIDVVFGSRPKTVAERFCQGCGWLTRGRRSKDRSDRMLYFFTAIEALLSSSDSSSPIVQTIARNASVIISDDNAKRERWSSDIKKLYSVRSSIIHNGTRRAYEADANSTQFIAEMLYDEVWKRVDLAGSHQEFSRALHTASYGMPLAEVLAKKG